MRKLGLEAIYPKLNLSKPGRDHLTYPYLLKGALVEYSDGVWATGITYIILGSGFVYLLVIMDWRFRLCDRNGSSSSLELHFLSSIEELEFITINPFWRCGCS